MDAQQTKSPSLVTDLQINLCICQHAFKFLPDTVSDKNSWNTLAKRCFFLLVLTSSLSKLFIAVRSPNLVHQHWGEKETAKCPNHFDWGCSYIPVSLFTDLHSVLSLRTSYVHRFDSEVLSKWNLTYHVLVRNDYYYHYYYYHHPR